MPTRGSSCIRSVPRACHDKLDAQQRLGRAPRCAKVLSEQAMCPSAPSKVKLDPFIGRNGCLPSSMKVWVRDANLILSESVAHLGIT